MDKEAPYVQGQSPSRGVREYFYFIDHQGMLFLDDTKIKNFTSCFKDVKFLEFFFSRLRLNTSSRYTCFPYLSPCGRERNYVHCDDVPLVYTAFVEGSDPPLLRYNHGGRTMTAPWQPEAVLMGDGGRLYHPPPLAPPALFEAAPAALIATKLALKLADGFRFEGGEEVHPSHLEWAGREYVLHRSLDGALRSMADRRGPGGLEEG